MTQILKKKYTPHLSILILIVIFSISISLNPTNEIIAQTPTPTPTATPIPADDVPQMYIFEAYGFNNIATEYTNDFFVLIRYQLDYTTVADSGWCKQIYLVDPAGCELSPPNPDFSFSLLSGRAYAEVTECTSPDPQVPSCTGTGQTHIQNSKIPRIGHGLMGLYAEAPAGSSWSDGFGFYTPKLPAKVCLKYNTDYFYPSANILNENLEYNQCRTIQNISGGATQLSRFVSGGDGILYNLENDMGLPVNTFVNNRGKVTPTGVVFLQEALQGIGRIAQDTNGDTIFELGTGFPNENYTPSGTSSNFQEKIELEASTSGITEDMRIIASEYLGFDSAGWAASLIFIVVGLIASVAAFMATRNAFFTFAAFGMMLLPAMFVGGLSIPLLFTGISLSILIGSWYWIRRSAE